MTAKNINPNIKPKPTINPKKLKSYLLWKTLKVDPFIEKYLIRKDHVHHCDKDIDKIPRQSLKYYQKIRDDYENNKIRVHAKYQLYLDRDLDRFKTDFDYRASLLKHFMAYIKLFKYYIDNYFELRKEYEEASDRVYNMRSQYRKVGLEPKLQCIPKPPKIRKNASTKNYSKRPKTPEEIQEHEIKKLTKQYIQEAKKKKQAQVFKAKNL
jgi:uncharacterized membrane-anchored protein YhcB (DUF1043 family)